MVSFAVCHSGHQNSEIKTSLHATAKSYHRRTSDGLQGLRRAHRLKDSHLCRRGICVTSCKLQAPSHSIQSDLTKRTLLLWRCRMYCRLKAMLHGSPRQFSTKRHSMTQPMCKRDHQPLLQPLRVTTTSQVTPLQPLWSSLSPRSSTTSTTPKQGRKRRINRTLFRDTAPRHLVSLFGMPHQTSQVQIRICIVLHIPYTYQNMF